MKTRLKTKTIKQALALLLLLLLCVGGHIALADGAEQSEDISVVQRYEAQARRV